MAKEVIIMMAVGRRLLSLNKPANRRRYEYADYDEPTLLQVMERGWGPGRGVKQDY